MPTKPKEVQAAMKTHLSQSTGAGVLDGQQGMSFAISTGSDMSGIVCIDISGDIVAMTGRETGANARPAIKTIARSRRMATMRFTDLNSHTLALIYPTLLQDRSSIWPALISIRPPTHIAVQLTCQIDLLQPSIPIFTR